MGKRKRAGGSSKPTFCDICECTVAPKSWKTHVNGWRHQQEIALHDRRETNESHGTINPSQTGSTMAWQFLPASVAALAGTGPVYHRVFQYLSQNQKAGRLRVEEFARGTKIELQNHAPQHSASMPLDVMVAADCVYGEHINPQNFQINSSSSTGQVTSQGDSAGAGPQRDKNGDGTVRCNTGEPPGKNWSQFKHWCVLWRSCYAGSHLTVLRADGATLMGLAEHVCVNRYRKMTIGVMTPIAGHGAKGIAAMAALTCLLQCLKQCVELEEVEVTFQIDLQEKAQTMTWPPVPIPRHVMEVRALACVCRWASQLP